jgi:hypothetical protein
MPISFRFVLGSVLWHRDEYGAIGTLDAPFQMALILVVVHGVIPRLSLLLLEQAA